MTDTINVSVLTAQGKTLQAQIRSQDTTLQALAEQVAEHVGAKDTTHMSFVLPRRVVTARKHGDLLCSKLMANGDSIVVSSLSPKLASNFALSRKSDGPSVTSSSGPEETGDAAWPKRIQRAKQRTAQLHATQSIPPDAVLAVKKAGLDPMEYNAGAVAIFVRVAEMAGSGYAHQRIWAACQEAGFECQHALRILFGQQTDNHDGGGGRDLLRQSISMDSVSSISATSYTGDLLNGTSPVMTLLDRTPTSSTAPESARDFDGLTSQQPSPSPLSPPRPHGLVASQPSTPSSTTGVAGDGTRHTLVGTPASSTTDASDAAPFTPPSASDHDPTRQGIRYLDSPVVRFRGPSFVRENGNVRNVTALRPDPETSPSGTPLLPTPHIPAAPVPTLVLPDHVVHQQHAQEQQQQQQQQHESSSQGAQVSSTSTGGSSHSGHVHARATVRHQVVHSAHEPLAVSHEDDADYLAHMPVPRHHAGHQHHVPLGVDNDDTVSDRVQNARVVRGPTHRVHPPLGADTDDLDATDHNDGTSTNTTTTSPPRHPPGHVHHRAMDSTILAPQVARITQHGAPVVQEPHHPQTHDSASTMTAPAGVSELTLTTTSTSVQPDGDSSASGPPTDGAEEASEDPRDRVIGRWVDMPGHGAVNTRILASVVRDQRVRELLQRPEMVHGLSLYLDQLLHLDDIGALHNDGSPAIGATAVLLDEVAHRLGIQDALRHLDGIVLSETRPDE